MKQSLLLVCLVFIGCGQTSIHEISGPAGAVGATGVQGTAGVNGTNGTNGATGPQGNTGAPGSQGIQGATGSPGIQGNAGAVGASGAQGIPGTPGTNGTNGTNGIDGVSPTATYSVQFCSSQGATVYPSNFPEYGLCIANVLYGVYYDGKNAWLSQIVPGAYMSTATGLQCDFQVLPNCVVQ